MRANVGKCQNLLEMRANAKISCKQMPKSPGNKYKVCCQNASGSTTNHKKLDGPVETLTVRATLL